MLNHDTKLFPHHIDPQRAYDFSLPVAEVVRHPSDPSRWGLRNLSGQKWVATTADGTFQDVSTGKSVAISRGIRINFGGSEGDIRVS